MTPPTAVQRLRRDQVVASVGRATTAGDVFDRASPLLRRIVPFDAAAWLGTDPQIGWPTSPTRIENLESMTHARCSEHWEDELLGEDVNLLRDLARAPVPAAALRATVDEPEHSGRYRRFLRPLELEDELRAVLRVGEARWGTLTLWRRAGQPPFTEREAQLVAGLSAPLGEALRRHALPTDDPVRFGHDRPGVFVFDIDGALCSVNEEARQWLAELPPEPGQPTDLGIDVPLWLLITMFRASAVRHGAGDGTARTRVRATNGQWLACHASCVRRADGAIGETVVVIEPARPGATAPIVVEAYDLTDREQEIIGLIARGTGTGDIAAELFLSRHTVRDHVKAIFAKVGVSSRGQLVAKLFSDFVSPLHKDPSRVTTPPTTDTT